MNWIERIKHYFTKPIVEPGTFWVNTRSLGVFKALKNPEFHNQFSNSVLVYKILVVNSKEVVYTFGYSNMPSSDFKLIDSVPKRWFDRGYYTQVNYE